MNLLAGKNVLITGVLTDQSIAFHVAKLAQEEGANVVLTSFGRTMSLTKRSASRLPKECPIVELDVTSESDLGSLADRLAHFVPHLDGVLHSIGFAPESALGGNFLHTKWDDVATAFHVSTFSIKSLAVATQPLLVEGSSIVGLDFDATVAWPTYDWMGVAKAGLESAARYLARDLGPLGIRVNLVAAGPIRTMAAKNIPGFEEFESIWATRAPLGWDVTNPLPAAQACIALMSDWFPATSGEIIHVDGGMHSQGA
jgi:enoyl-[acyl-carrier protein] reductase I